MAEKWIQALLVWFFANIFVPVLRDLIADLLFHATKWICIFIYQFIIYLSQATITYIYTHFCTVKIATQQQTNNTNNDVVHGEVREYFSCDKQSLIYSGLVCFTSHTNSKSATLTSLPEFKTTQFVNHPTIFISNSHFVNIKHNESRLQSVKATSIDTISTLAIELSLSVMKSIDNCRFITSMTNFIVLPFVLLYHDGDAISYNKYNWPRQATRATAEGPPLPRLCVVCHWKTPQKAAVLKRIFELFQANFKHVQMVKQMDQQWNNYIDGLGNNQCSIKFKPLFTKQCVLHLDRQRWPRKMKMKRHLNIEGRSSEFKYSVVINKRHHDNC